MRTGVVAVSERAPNLPKITEPATSEVLRRRVLVLLAATNGKAPK
jgi:hypothetical protein